MFRDGKRSLGSAPENSRLHPLPGRPRLWADRPLEGRGAALFRWARRPDGTATARRLATLLSALGLQEHEAGDILREELPPKVQPKRIAAPGDEVFVEVPERR